MSRIHEALQKAEQERNSAQPLESSPIGATLPVLPGDLAVAPLPPVDAHQPLTSPAPAKPPSRTAVGVTTAWNPNLEKMLFFDSSKHNEVGMEEFRTLRSRLAQLREKRPMKIVLVASALPSEGKSFVAANLAQAIARQHGRRALLIDCDLRRASLHEYLGTNPTPGMNDYLAGTADEFSIIQRGPMDGLFFIPRGTEVANPAELIANGRSKILLQNLAPHFDWIIVDSPPAVPVTDASLLAQHCDGVLLVVRAGSTPYEQTQRAAQEFRDKALIGVVLNQASVATGSYDGYYNQGYGGYGPVKS